MTLILFMVSVQVINAPPVYSTQKMSSLGKAIHGIATRQKTRMTKKRAEQLASYFNKYGNKWKVDSWLGASIAAEESRFTDNPPPIYLERCNTMRILAGKYRRICKLVWPGELGMMQIIPQYAVKSFRACTKKVIWNSQKEFLVTETNICIGMHLLSARRARVKARNIGKGFIVRRARFRYARKYLPCTKRQKSFCSNGNASLCRKFWWVASWNWGSHRMICGRPKGTIDFEGYPIRILYRYKMMVSRYRI